MAKQPAPSPAYLMYPSDILSSGRVAALKPLEELWYRRALDLGWEHGGMPSDAGEFAGWVGRGCTLKAAELIIAKFYKPHKRDASKVINARQEKERTLLNKKRQQKSEAGRRGMANRWKQKGNGDNSVITEDNIPIPISIPKDSSKEESKKTPLPPSPKGVVAEGKKPDSEIQTWLDAIAVACGAKDLRSLPKRDRWAAVVVTAIREDRDLGRMLEVIATERKRLGNDTQFFTPEGCLQKLQMMQSPAASSASRGPTGRQLAEEARQREIEIDRREREAATTGAK